MNATFSRIARVPSEAFDADMIEWRCEVCCGDEYSCFCDNETCGKCEWAIDADGYCHCKASEISLDEVEAQIARVFGGLEPRKRDDDRWEVAA